MSIKAVFFDVGETLVNEEREYGTWADWLGVPRHTFSSVFGSIVAQGKDYRDTFRVFDPEFDLAEQRRARASAGRPESFGEADLYPDARPCLNTLQEMGITVGIAGNQTARAETILRELQLPADIIGTSDGWGVEKPDTRFFERIVVEAAVRADEVLYVGDRLDNDIKPAQEVGLRTALTRRGPWAYILSLPYVESRCTFRFSSLAEIPDAVRAYNDFRH